MKGITTGSAIASRDALPRGTGRIRIEGDGIRDRPDLGRGQERLIARCLAQDPLASHRGAVLRDQCAVLEECLVLRARKLAGEHQARRQKDEEQDHQRGDHHRVERVHVEAVKLGVVRPAASEHHCDHEHKEAERAGIAFQEAEATRAIGMGRNDGEVELRNTPECGGEQNQAPQPAEQQRDEDRPTDVDVPPAAEAERRRGRGFAFSRS